MIQGAMITYDVAIQQPVQYWLSAVYAYDELAMPIMEDATFDALARYITENWLVIEHRHKYLINENQCGSSIDKTASYDQWPNIIKDATIHLANRIHGNVHGRYDHILEHMLHTINTPDDGSDLI